MKSVVSLALIGAFFAIAMASPSPSDLSLPDSDQKPVMDECKSMENATDEDVQNLLHEIQTQTPLQNLNEKCLLACLYEKSGVIANGHIQSDGLKMAILQDDKKSVAPIDKIIQECAMIKNPERCEQAAQLKMCLDKMTASSASN